MFYLKTLIMKLQLLKDFELSDGKHKVGYVFEAPNKAFLDYFTKKGLAKIVSEKEEETGYPKITKVNRKK